MQFLLVHEQKDTNQNREPNAPATDWFRTSTSPVRP
jgi:hypothetical protein